MSKRKSVNINVNFTECLSQLADNNNDFNQQLYNSPWVFRLGTGLGGGKK
ncbi:hypothetical protein QNI16_38125 [Cytophagaceae bacterium YF14B1]|uniref:Uncharacterized protein n=1 Tax=Xanthocytophaga flava TaxID=3048013 RepID=A0AAE3QVT6_9BACT|nr:hypothetical protein [Xanthocytophaga flavus]MDJ1486360.1 hypothetical protein [Xanthocytophaga flavus]